MFIKFNNIGNAEAAPKFKKLENGSTLIGYNNPSNKKMLYRDGYIEYTGNMPLYCLSLKDGVIVENPIQVKTLKFTKLKIRRVLRKLNLEHVLNKLLSSNEIFTNDWNDSIDICINDEVFYNGFKSMGLSDATLNNIIKKLMMEQQ